MFEYDMKAKQELDKLIRQRLTIFEQSGREPTKISVSPEFYDNLRNTFPSWYVSVIEFDNLPVIEDKTLIDEQIVIQ